MLKVTIPTGITCIRIFLTPWIVYEVVHRSWGLAAGLFLLAVLSDFFDGFLARRYKQESKLGAMLDPIADKILLVSLFYVLLLYYIHDELLRYFIWFLMCKELLIVCGAAFLLYWKSFLARPTFFSRIISVTEMLFVLMLLVATYFGYTIPYVFVATMLGVLCVLSVGLFVNYMKIISQLKAAE